MNHRGGYPAPMMGAPAPATAASTQDPARALAAEPPPVAAPARIGVVVPCFDRPDDARALLHDLAAVVASTPDVRLRVVLVDNASRVPLSTLTTPDGVDLEHVRLPTNTGGSGGYNAGLARVLGLDQDEHAARWAAFDPGFIWLIDSDARVLPSTLPPLLAAMRTHPAIVAAGPAIADPGTGQVFEVGGVVHRGHGRFEPAVGGRVGLDAHRPIACDYLAACCALVKTDAARAAGLWPDRFLNADDVEWFIRLRQITGGVIAAVPGSIAFHPRFDRFPTWTRYYAARNALGPVDALGLPRSARALRTLREVARAVQQSMIGRDDLAALHMRGLSDAASGRTLGPAPAGTLNVRPSRPLSELDAAVREYLRLPPGSPTPPIAQVAARGRPAAWLRRGLHAQVADGRCTLVEGRPVRQTLAAAGALLRGGLLAARTLRGPRDTPSPLNLENAAGLVPPLALVRKLSLEIIVLSYNRWPALSATLKGLLADPLVAAGRPDALVRITVIDNASTDGTPERLAAEFPDVRFIGLASNLGVEAFNRAVHGSSAGAVLILDDDALPAPGALTIALRRLVEDPRRAAVTLHPLHPGSGKSEWPFARAAAGAPCDRWPVMGCANLVRRADWLALGGYDAAFFLYRNDADLAMRLLAAGRLVHFDPALTVWHDTASGPGARKSTRWHRLATRNWLWMSRRHGQGAAGVVGAALGAAWAVRAAGFSPARLWSTARGVVDGLLAPPPRSPTPGTLTPPPGPTPMARYLRLRLLGRAE